MARRKLLLASTLTGFLICGCGLGFKQPEVSAAGAAPVTANPIGPIPGGGSPPPVAINPYTNDRTALEQGRKLFVEYNCYGCHGGHAGGGMGPSLRDAAWIYGSSDSDVFNSIAQGRSQGMPAWGTKLPQDQIWQLVSYVKSLRTPEEPDSPEK